jgi:hypothetical protein
MAAARSQLGKTRRKERQKHDSEVLGCAEKEKPKGAERVESEVNVV